MRCQPGRRTLLISLSVAPDSGLTANLSLALRAGAGGCRLSAGSLCPRRKLCGGVPLDAEPLQPTPQGVRHPGPGRRWASPRRVDDSWAIFTIVGIRVHRDLIHRCRGPPSPTRRRTKKRSIRESMLTLSGTTVHCPLRNKKSARYLKTCLKYRAPLLTIDY